MSFLYTYRRIALNLTVRVKKIIGDRRRVTLQEYTVQYMVRARSRKRPEWRFNDLIVFSGKKNPLNNILKTNLNAFELLRKMSLFRIEELSNRYYT